MIMLYLCILMFFISFVISYLAMPIACKYALRYNIIDYPDNVIKTHRQPTPYLGGAAMYLSFVLPLLICFVFLPKISPNTFGAVLLGGTMMLILGLVDDVKNLSPQVRLIVQALAALILFLGGLRLYIKILPEPLNIILTFLWVVGITNAFNIIDVMDGLSAGVAFIASFIFLVIALAGQNLFTGLIAAVLAGALLGFLRFNFPPARIFMGNAGSNFIGFVIAALAMAETYTEVNKIALLTPILILAIPIYDTILVIVLRFCRGESITAGSRDHLAFRLKALGLNDRQVLLVIYTLGLVLGIISLMVVKVSLEWAIFIYILILIAAFWAGRRLSRIKI